MGQRLNIEIVNGEKPLANCYYHWSAYTYSALELTRMVIDAYYDSKLEVGLSMAISLLETTGGGINEEERSNINKKPAKYRSIKFKDAVDRNSGLISVTEHGMEETRRWEEGRVTIDLSSETFCFDVLWTYSGEEYEEEFGEEYNEPADKLAKCNYDLSAVPFADIGNLIDFVDDNPEGAVDDEEGLVYQWIA